MRLPGDVEGGGDALAGDVVVSRADAAGGEHVGELLPDLVHRRDDRFGDVGDDADLAQGDPEIAQFGGEKADVGVLGAAGEDFVADDQHAGGGVVGWHCLGPLQEVAQ